LPSEDSGDFDRVLCSRLQRMTFVTAILTTDCY
jgi:hypothetical protein